ncbi:MAG TPA: hypothetical protein VGY77_09085 [Gemmataceae bacterium]|nr:hypothetical protein [Gemmataceae bacterium]
MVRQVASMGIWIGLLAAPAVPVRGADSPAKVYVILWFDTEDYILPASDDAALKVADFLTREQVRATFKVVGEKARTLQNRNRTDVIAALKKHEIGYHSNFHSVQPSPAMYLANLTWDEGVAEFNRREGPGREDINRIFGTYPTCYGQPGSSWAPQVYGTMCKWQMPVYLDSGSHLNLEDKPCYYCGILNLYKLAHTLRADLHNRDLQGAEDAFLAARKKLLAEGGGVVSIYYHPCEFVHKEFWDGVNFRNGANPPREQWKLPPMKTPEESKRAYEVLENYVRFIKRFPEVQFITASEAARIYRDRARGRKFTPPEIKAIAARVAEQVSFQKHEDFTLAAGEVFFLLNQYLAAWQLNHQIGSIELTTTPLGPGNPPPPLTEEISIGRSQFWRTINDVGDYLETHKQIPATVWLGSVAVPPEAYLRALARLAVDLIDEKPVPETITVKRANLAVAAHVAEDSPKLWGWVIFPRGFRAPAMMELAKRQAWTLKPALLNITGK